MRAPKMSALRDEPAGGLRLAVTLLTIVPLPASRRPGGPIERSTARWAMLLAPLAGLITGGCAALTLLLGDRLELGGPLRAALAVAVTAALTRALHLDGLADLADALGSGRPRDEALAIMKRSDIGPFGVVTLLFTVLIQVAALASAPHGTEAALVAAVTARLALPWACRAEVPAARPDGLGALVAGTVSTRDALIASGAVLVAAGAAGAVWGGLDGALHALAAVVLGIAAAFLLLRHAVRRLGGVTGDVLGALVEVAGTAALITLVAL